jgi:Restriction Enzyme Adenine Methylase Associated
MRRKRQPLVCQFLEHASSEVLEEHGSHLRDLVGRSHGVYSLYKRDVLYYVGLASNLRGRLEQHLRDRHKGLWTNFSLYLTLESGFMKELESLVLRIAEPKGNKQRGKFARAQSLLKTLKRRIKAEDEKKRNELFRSHLRKPKRVIVKKGGRKNKKGSRRTPILAKYPGHPKSLRRIYKDKKYTAQVRRDGSIRVRGIVGRFTSPSLAAMAIANKPMNGWSFWTYQQAPGKWSTLNALRRR